MLDSLCGVEAEDVGPSTRRPLRRPSPQKADGRSEEAKKAELRLLLEATLLEGDEDWTELVASVPFFGVGASVAEDPRDARDHWKNYNIAVSLRPNVLDAETFRAAELIIKRARIYLAKRRATRMSIAGDLAIMEREIDKMQRAWRRHVARRRMAARRFVVEGEAKRWKSFEAFRGALASREGVRVLRWNQSQRRTERCVLRVDKQRKHLVVAPAGAAAAAASRAGRLATSRFRLKDFYKVTMGYESDFLRNLVVQAAPEKQLSLWWRDAQGRTRTLDVAFEDGQSIDVAEDGRSRCDRFYRGFSRLLGELQSESAFFFDATGAYGRVTRSVFDRWEQVVLLDPSWARSGEEAETTTGDGAAPLSPARDASSRGRRAPPGCLLPRPLAERDKPQNRPLDVVYAHADRSGDRRAAAWWSETVTVSYGDFFEDRFGDDESTREKRKERFVLQRCVWDGARWARVFRPRRKGEEGPPRPEPMPTPELLSYFEDATRRIYGHLGVNGWRSCESGDFEFDDANWKKIVDFALEKGGRAAATAAKLTSLDQGGPNALRIPRAPRTSRAPSPAEDHSAGRSGVLGLFGFLGRRRRPPPPTSDSGASSAGSDDEVDEARPGESQGGTGGGGGDRDALRRKLLRQIYCGDDGGKKADKAKMARGTMYEPGSRSYNSSQKMTIIAISQKIFDDAQQARAEILAKEAAADRAAKGCENPNFKGLYLGRFPLVLADFRTSDHLSERSRSMTVVSRTRARGTAKLKRR